MKTLGLLLVKLENHPKGNTTQWTIRRECSTAREEEKNVTFQKNYLSNGFQ
jgi:hypothetical protein